MYLLVKIKKNEYRDDFVTIVACWIIYSIVILCVVLRNIHDFVAQGNIIFTFFFKMLCLELN